MPNFDAFYHPATGLLKRQVSKDSGTVPFLFTVPAPPEAVPCSCGGLYSTGGRVRAHQNYTKKTGAADEAAFFKNARALRKKKEIEVFHHPDPKK